MYAQCTNYFLGRCKKCKGVHDTVAPVYHSPSGEERLINDSEVGQDKSICRFQQHLLWSPTRGCGHIQSLSYFQDSF